MDVRSSCVAPWRRAAHSTRLQRVFNSAVRPQTLQPSRTPFTPLKGHKGGLLKGVIGPLNGRPSVRYEPWRSTEIMSTETGEVHYRDAMVLMRASNNWNLPVKWHFSDVILFDIIELFDIIKLFDVKQVVHIICVFKSKTFLTSRTWFLSKTFLITRLFLCQNFGLI